jgi:hypothetical protein
MEINLLHIPLSFVRHPDASDENGLVVEQSDFARNGTRLSIILLAAILWPDISIIRRMTKINT